MTEQIYLDNAATAFPKPESVLKAMTDFYASCGVNPGRSGYDLAVEAGLMIDGTRRTLDAFFANPAHDHNRLVFSANASDALNLLIQGICRRGDHVISTMLEHNSVLRPLYVMQADGLIDVDLVPFDGRGYVDPDEIARRIRPQTRLVVVTHGSNVIGTIQPVAEIGRLCRERGITFAIDTAQTAGVVPIDMGAQMIDVVAFTGHKSLMGPTGTGGLAIGPDVPIRSTRWGGTGVKSAVRTHLDEFPYRLEVGTLNTIGIAGLAAGQAWLAGRGLDAIRAHEMALTTRLLHGLREIDGVTTYCAGDGDDHLPVIACNVEGIEAGEVGTILDAQFEVAVRTGLHCAPLVHEGLGTAARKGAVRFSIGPFNSATDVDAAVNAMREITVNFRVG